MLHCAIYPRKSKADENSSSMETQITMCYKYLDDKYGADNYTATVYDADYGITGHSTKNRTDFLRMMEDIRAKKIQLVVIQRYDRIARNVRDFCNLYHDMEQNGCDLVSVSQQIDTTTPYGKNFMYMQASMAELEWALTSERRKDVAQYAIDHGIWNVRPASTPLGYKGVLIDNVKRLVIDEEKRPVINELFKHYKLYGNCTDTARHLNEMFNLSLARKTISDILKNPIYKGWRRNNHSFCEPYLTEKEWDELQERRPLVRTLDFTKKRDAIYTGLIKCPMCGNNLNAQNHKYKDKYDNTKYIKTYRCRKGHEGICTFKKNRCEKKIEKQVISSVKSSFAQLQYQFNIEKQAQKPDDTLQKLQNKLDRLNRMYLLGRISENDYDAEYEATTQSIALEKSKNKNNIDINKLDIVLNSNWESEYRQLDLLHKKLFWKSIIKEIIIDAEFNVTAIIFL